MYIKICAIRNDYIYGPKVYIIGYINFISMSKSLVTLPDCIMEIIAKELKGKMGDSDSELIRNIVVAYLSDHGYFDKTKK